MNDVLNEFALLHPVVKVILGALCIVFVLAIVKRLVKLAILVTIFIILIFVLLSVIP